MGVEVKEKYAPKNLGLRYRQVHKKDHNYCDELYQLISRMQSSQRGYKSKYEKLKMEFDEMKKLHTLRVAALQGRIENDNQETSERKAAR